MLVGVDEAGRGPWAGPLVAAAVILNSELKVAKIIKDSKKLSLKQREVAFAIIQKIALGIGFGWSSVVEIDRYGLTLATNVAMRRAMAQIQQPYQQVIIDGSVDYLRTEIYKTRAVIRADSLYPEVSAASIVAKVVRDRYIKNIAFLFPEYSFEKHVGYGTARHREALERHGPCSLHRRSFKPVKLMISNN